MSRESAVQRPKRTELLPSFCPKATSFNILARVVLLVGRVASILLSLSLSLLLLLTIPFLPFPLLVWSFATRWNFNTISFGSRWQTLPPTHFSSRATSLRSCFFTASRRRTIYNLNPRRSIEENVLCSPVDGTQAGRKVSRYSERTLIICCSISAAFVEFGNYVGKFGWGLLEQRVIGN